MPKDARQILAELNDLFWRLLGQLEDWYADEGTVRALNYSAGTHVTVVTPDDGHIILRRGHYFGPNWRKRWREAVTNPAAQAQIVRELKEEIYALSHGPSRAGPASGLHKGTLEWRQAIATEEGSLRAVGRKYGLHPEQVKRIRLLMSTI